MRENSWLTKNSVPSAKSLGEDTTGSYNSTCRLSLGNATRDWEYGEVHGGSDRIGRKK